MAAHLVHDHFARVSVPADTPRVQQAWNHSLHSAGG
jgi:hypothetical protein